MVADQTAARLRTDKASTLTLSSQAHSNWPNGVRNPLPWFGTCQTCIRRIAPERAAIAGMSPFVLDAQTSTVLSTSAHRHSIPIRTAACCRRLDTLCHVPTRDWSSLVLRCPVLSALPAASSARLDQRRQRYAELLQRLEINRRLIKGARSTRRSSARLKPK